MSYIPYVELLSGGAFLQDIQLVVASEDGLTVTVPPLMTNNDNDNAYDFPTTIFYPAAPLSDLFTTSAISVTPSQFIVTKDASGRLLDVSLLHRDNLPPLLNESFLLNTLEQPVQSVVPISAFQQGLLNHSFLIHPSGANSPFPLYGVYVNASGSSQSPVSDNYVIVHRLDASGPVPNSVDVISPRDIYGNEIISYYNTVNQNYVPSSLAYTGVTASNAADIGFGLMRLSMDESGLIMHAPFPLDATGEIIRYIEPSTGRPYTYSHQPDGTIRVLAPSLGFKVRHVGTGRVQEVLISSTAILSSYDAVVYRIIDTYLGATMYQRPNNITSVERATTLRQNIASSLSTLSSQPSFYDTIAKQIYQRAGANYLDSASNTGLLNALPRPFGVTLKTAVRFSVRRGSQFSVYEITDLALNFRIN